MDRLELSAEERAGIIRDFLAHRGWKLLLEPALARKLEQLRDQAILAVPERSKEYRSWSIDRLGGAAFGIGFARKFLQIWLDAYEAAERTAQLPSEEHFALGHPYGDDPGLANLMPESLDTVQFRGKL